MSILKFLDKSIKLYVKNITSILKSCLNRLHMQSNKNVRNGFICVFLFVLVTDSYYVLRLTSTLRPFCCDLITAQPSHWAQVGLESLFFFMNTLLAHLTGSVRKYLVLIFQRRNDMF